MNGKPYVVVKYSHSKIGRGGANVKLSIRNLETGILEEKTMNSNTKVEEITTVKKSLQFLYSDSDTAAFMNPRDYSQIQIPVSVIGEQLKFVSEGENVTVLFWNDKTLNVEIPPKVSLKVVDTAPGVKGNSATNIYKPAKLENDMELKVPLFIKNGDKIVVDTRTSEYIERDKSP